MDPSRQPATLDPIVDGLPGQAESPPCGLQRTHLAVRTPSIEFGHSGILWQGAMTRTRRSVADHLQLNMTGHAVLQARAA